MKILSIGNGLSRCAHTYLPKIAKCDNLSMILANLYFYSCSLEDYRKNADSDEGKYTFEYYDEGRMKLNEIENFTLARALGWEEWDVVTIQQSASLSGLKETFFPYIQELCAYIRSKCPSAMIFLHETWAYDSLYEGEEFDKYDRDTEKMQNMINSAYAAAFAQCGADGIIPAGRAFGIERTQSGTVLTGDGIHGSRAGDFLASAVWYCTLTGNDIRKNNYRLPFVDKTVTQRLKNTAYSVCSELKQPVYSRLRQLSDDVRGSYYGQRSVL